MPLLFLLRIGYQQSFQKRYCFSFFLFLSIFSHFFLFFQQTIALKDKKIGSAAGMVIDGDRLVCVGHCQDRGATLHFGWNAPKDFQPEGGWKSLIEKVCWN